MTPKSSTGRTMASIGGAGVWFVSARTGWEQDGVSDTSTSKRLRGEHGNVSTIVISVQAERPTLEATCLEKEDTVPS